MNDRVVARAAVVSAALLLASLAVADDADLARQTLNPVASLISVPMQVNLDQDIGPANGKRYVVNVQPVVPFGLTARWNLISRTIVPLINQADIPLAGSDESGVGDVVQSFFLSPKQPTKNGWIWGLGPVLLLPTASDERLGAEQYGIGPTVVVLKQKHGWTYGALANHIVSVAGDDDRPDVESTFVQPFLSFTTPSFTTYGINTESTYDWERDEWLVPINLSVTQLLRIGRQPLSVQAGVRYWMDSPASGPEGWGLRLAVTLLFPK